MLLWIDSDDHSKKTLLSNIENLKNEYTQLEMEPNLASKIAIKDQCLVLSMAQREVDITHTDGETFYLNSISCIKKASTVCVIDSNTYSPTFKRSKLPCISKISKSRNRRDTNFESNAEFTSGHENEQQRGIFYT